MAIKIRIISADKSKIIEKRLPALPARLKIPEGAKVEIFDEKTDQTMSLVQYVNAHTKDAGENGNTGMSGVTVETAETWNEAVAWLDSYDGLSKDDMSSTSLWYNPPDRPVEIGDVVSFNSNTLVLGGVLVGGLAIGAVALGGGGSSTPADTIAPAPPTALDLATDDDNGLSTTDNITSKTSEITISGTAEAGSSVEVFDGTTSLGKATATAAGTFTIEGALTEGTHSITARATDIAGNVSVASTALSVRVDTTGPAAPTGLDLLPEDDSGRAASDNITAQTSALTINGTTEAGARVELFDGTVSLGTATANASGVFALNVSLTEGVHQITARATDAAGNVGEALSAALTITIDTTIPPAPTGLDLDASDDNGVSRSDNITTQTSDLTISGLADPGATVRLLNGSEVIGTTSASANGIFLLDINLPVGTHNIIARATDAAGNQGPSSQAMTIVVQAQTAGLIAPDSIVVVEAPPLDTSLGISVTTIG